MEREKNFSLLKGVGGEPLENMHGGEQLLDYRWGDLGQPVCLLPFEKLKGALHLFLEKLNLFTPTLTLGMSF